VTHEGRAYCASYWERIARAAPQPRAPVAQPVTRQAGTPRGNGLATTSLILGIVSAAVGWVPYLCYLVAAAAVTGLVFAICAISARKTRREFGNAGLPGLVLSLVGLFLCVFGFVWTGVLEHRKKHVDAQPAALVRAEEVVATYYDNEVRAKHNFEGKRLRVRGKVVEIDDRHGQAVVKLDGGKAKGLTVAVECRFVSSAKPDIAALNKGDTIVAEGVCRGRKGFIIKNVVFERCSIAK